MPLSSVLLLSAFVVQACRQLHVFLFFMLWLFSTTVLAEKQLLWGDTHLHSFYSPDAYLNQNSSVGPDDAYRFAQGLAVAHPITGEPLTLETPLDFLVVTDHAESMGVFKAAHERAIPREGLGFFDSIKATLIEWGMGYLFRIPPVLPIY